MVLLHCRLEQVGERPGAVREHVEGGQADRFRDIGANLVDARVIEAFVIETLFATAISMVNTQFDDAKVENADDFRLTGEGAQLDSLALVSLFVALESEIEKSQGKRVSIVTEESFQMANSPFETIGTLKAYLRSLLNE